MISPDLLGFCLFFLGLGLYLIWSAKTEMGTKIAKPPDADRR